jgi:uncharacterized membrane protein
MKASKYLTQAALIGALYAGITIALAPISYGPVQVRVSEALTVLPFFTWAAIPGLFVGTIIANIFGGNGPMDVLFGSLATLLAAFLSYKMPKKWLVPLPPVIVNGIVVGYLLHYLYQMPLLLTMGYVTIGQLIACYGLGYPFIRILEKYKSKIFN